VQIENAVLQKAGELQRQRHEDNEDAAGHAAEDGNRGASASADRAGNRDEGGAASGASDAAGNGASKDVPDVVRFQSNPAPKNQKIRHG
jgi:hypothetical protein